MIRSRAAYTWLIRAMLPLALARLVLRARRERGYLARPGERFGYGDAPATSQPTIWVHAVSLGETRAAAPLVERLLAAHPGHRILLTHMTATGRAAGEQLYGDRVSRCWLPYDLPGAVARFLERHRPIAGLLMETEVWFNLIHACAERGIPLWLANARLSEKSAAGYRRFPELSAEAFGALAGVAAQGEADAERFRALGARNVAVTGNVKFEISPPEEMLARGRNWRRAWGGARPVWLAASTREGEEALLLAALAGLDVPGLLTVIVPRHPQRFDEVAEAVRRAGLRLARRSRDDRVGPDTQVLLGDTVGEMFAWYAACDVAFVGGSLLPYGCHNLLEPCAVGVPVLVGPSDFNFAEAVAGAVDAGAARRVADAHALVAEVAGLLRDAPRREAMARAGLEFTRAHRGAAGRLLRFCGLGGA